MKFIGSIIVVLAVFLVGNFSAFACSAHLNGNGDDGADKKISAQV